MKICHELDITCSPDLATNYGYEFSRLYWLILNIFHKIWVFFDNLSLEISWNPCGKLLNNKNIFCWFLGFSRIYHHDLLKIISYFWNFVKPMRWKLNIFYYFSGFSRIYHWSSWPSHGQKRRNGNAGLKMTYSIPPCSSKATISRFFNPGHLVVYIFFYQS